jgi:hypothetical protein
MGTNCNFDEQTTAYIPDDFDIINIDMMIDQLNSFIDMYEVIKLNITEDFPKRGIKKYSVLNLIGEREGDFVFFTDGEDTMTYKNHVLNLFTQDQIKRVLLYWKPMSGKCSFILEFKDGQVYIEAKFP